MSQEINFVSPIITPAGKLVLLGMLSIALMVLDNRYAALQQGKSYVSAGLYPLQWAARQPAQWVSGGTAFLRDKQDLLAENSRLKEENARLNMQLQLQTPAARELAALKTLNRLQPLLAPKAVLAEVVSNGRIPQTNRLLVTKGSSSGIRIGDPVSDEKGLIGQITAVQPATAEVTLINNRQSVIPAMVAESGVRTLVYGRGETLDLRYFPVSAELKEGDLLVTSGIDSIYPAGIPIAKVVSADRNSGTPYYRTVLTPAANLSSSNYVLVIPQKPQAAVRLPETASEPAAEQETQE
ncbi:rod shape-determining protein MreC [Eikenella corrodens]|uniref:Cell shape-determining protein MreC n=1 Tax=Eikenella corrodens TaxID=539 RepID=A0A3S9SKC4_EIKCO|nr:rod shape-determining protein MreC [Eikenella corrodens]AZR59973.1 rod shape-determining protein MreC [Eikenella corrodens]